MKARFDWDAIRRDAHTMTDDELAAKHGCAVGTILTRRSEERTRGLWPPRVIPNGDAPPPPRALRAAEGGTGTPASHAANLERVPDEVLALPWTSYPKDADTARVLATMMENAARGDVVRKLGAEATSFFTSHAAYLRALADRTGRSKAVTRA